MSRIVSPGRSQSANGSDIGHAAVIALNRDATTCLEMRLLPPTSTSARESTEWLLLHTIPVSASLSTVLSRVLDTELQAKCKESILEGDPTVCGGESSWIRVARVGYVLSEIHAYCMILQCGTATEAMLLKAMLEKDAALGVTIPVENVADQATMLVVDEGVDGGAREDRQQLAASARADKGNTMSPHSCGTVSWTVPLSVAIQGNLTTAGLPQSMMPQVWLPSQACLHPAAVPIDTRRRSTLRPLQSPGDTPCRASPKVGSCNEICAICQEELTATQPRVVILCHHVFHMACYARMPSAFADCPLCRFSLYDLLNNVQCVECRTYQDLWACLICGHVGCGQGRHNHQRLHYDRTGHSCSWQSSTNRIWNHCSRMFLHQEVAIILGECSDEDSSFMSLQAKKREKEGFLQPSSARATASDLDWACSTSAFVDEEDVALQTALTQSKEEAVQRFYTDVLHTLLGEQRNWYKALIQHDRTHSEPLGHWSADRSEGRRNAACMDHATSCTSSVSAQCMESVDLGGERKVESHRAVAALIEAEHHQRVGLVRLYVGETREALSVISMILQSMTKKYQTMRVDLQEQVMLQLHRNSGLKSCISKIMERTRKAQINGEKVMQTKQVEAQRLQEKIAAALEHYIQ